ncbi:MAG TPA: DMT family transporter [Mycobacteriales bacterium]|nr:DMT family transporter [Mycobacteriales bacterium]
MNRRERTGLRLALVTAFISGVAVFVNGYGVAAVKDATAYTTGKNLVAALVLAVVATIVSSRTRGRAAARPVTLRQRAALVLVGVIGGSVPFVLFFEGLARESSTTAAFLQKTLVVWVSLLAVPLLSERVGGLQIAAIALLVVGQAMAGGSLGAVVRMPLGSGELMILAATLLWAVEVVIAKRLLGSLTSWTVGVARMTIGSLLLVAWLAVRGRLDALTSLDGSQWAWVLVTGVILAAYVATWFAALARAQAVDVTAILVVAAPVTALLSSYVHHVPLGPQIGGLVLIAAGASVVVLARLRRPSPVRVPG